MHFIAGSLAILGGICAFMQKDYPLVFWASGLYVYCACNYILAESEKNEKNR